MNILINTNYSAACTDMLFEVGDKLKSRGHAVYRNDWDHYEKYDLIFFVAKDCKVKVKKATAASTIKAVLDCVRKTRIKARSKNCQFFLVP